MKKSYIILVAMFALNVAYAQWLQQNSPTGYGLNSVYFTDENTGFAVGDNGTILKTTNGGINWLTQNSGTDVILLSVHFPTVDTGYAVGVGETILKTVNGGGFPVSSNDLTSKSNTLKIYPNPSSDFITIKTSTIPIKSELSICNLHGHELMTRQITEPKTILNISNLPSGVCFLRLTNDRTVEVEKMIKQ